MNTKLEKILTDNKDSKFLLWGASNFLKKFLSLNKGKSYPICAIIDRNPELYGKTICGYKIISPDEITDFSPAKVIVTIENQCFQAYKNISEYITGYHSDKIELLPNIFREEDKNLKSLNHIFLIDSNGEKQEIDRIDGLNVIFYGSNSVVEIGSNPIPVFSDSMMKIASNTKVQIGSSNHCILNMNILINAENSELKIGKNFSCEGLDIMMLNEKKQKITIGDDCMFSGGIKLRSSDCHTVYDIKTNKILNKSNGITINNHVWVSEDAMILKNSVIPTNSIVGAKSLVNKKFEKENVIIAGNPAKIVKTGINWNRNRVE